MIAYRLRLKIGSPLVIAGRHAAQGGATESLDYIPGSALRGALAAFLLRAGTVNTDPSFQTLFVSDLVRYGNLYPTVEDAVTPTWPLPATAWSCNSTFAP